MTTQLATKRSLELELWPSQAPDQSNKRVMQHSFVIIFLVLNIAILIMERGLCKKSFYEDGATFWERKIDS